jgi:hypothetical protein
MKITVIIAGIFIILYSAIQATMMWMSYDNARQKLSQASVDPSNPQNIIAMKNPTDVKSMKMYLSLFILTCVIGALGIACVGYGTYKKKE